MSGEATASDAPDVQPPWLTVVDPSAVADTVCGFSLDVCVPEACDVMCSGGGCAPMGVAVGKGLDPAAYFTVELPSSDSLSEYQSIVLCCQVAGSVDCVAQAGVAMTLRTPTTDALVLGFSPTSISYGFTTEIVLMADGFHPNDLCGFSGPSGTCGDSNGAARWTMQ